jgi:hypothetical protein
MSSLGMARLAEYEDVNDADRLGRDPAMRWIVGGKGFERGGLETELLATDLNLAALADLLGIWIHRVHRRKPPKIIVLDMDSCPMDTIGAIFALSQFPSGSMSSRAATTERLAWPVTGGTGWPMGRLPGEVSAVSEALRGSPARICGGPRQRRF